MDKIKGAVLAVVVIAGIALFYYGDIIFNSKNLVLGSSGDGYKNYYTVAYYLRYNSGAHFTGMNYPFGENVIFTDNQPALTWLFKPVAKVIPAINYHVHGILLAAFCFSFLLSAFLVYKILELFKLPWLYALAATAFITMLAPQIQRASGHFALSYTVLVPAILYMLVNFLNAPDKDRYVAGIAVIMCIAGFIQMYYVAMGALFIIPVSVLWAISQHQRANAYKAQVIKLIAASVLPLVLLKVYLLITDPVTDRPALPWGYVISRSTVADIFLDPYSFTGKLLTEYFPAWGIVFHGEGRGYIGLVTIIILLAAILAYSSSKLRAQIFEKLYPLNLFALPACIVLLFAMAFPFNIDQLEKYYVLLPAAIKQFRASGRFNWIFYYNATILAAVLGYRLLHWLHTNNKVAAYIAGSILLLIAVIETDMISRGVNNDLIASSGPFQEKMLEQQLNKAFKKAGLKPDNFQAILPLPFFLTGSEKIYIDGGAFTTDAMQASLFTGLPLVATQMSRTSQFQTFEIADLLSGPLIKKDVLRFFNQKPLLIATDGNGLNQAENTLLSKAQFLFISGRSKFYCLPLSAFSDSIEQVKDYVHAHMNKLALHSNYLSNDSVNNTVLLEFNGEQAKDSFPGMVGHYSNDTPVIFYHSILPHAESNTVYELSFWTATDARRPAYPVMTYTQTDSAGKVVEERDCDPKFSTNIVGNWVRGSIEFRLRSASNKVTVTGNGEYATFAEVMIRPVDVTVISRYTAGSGFAYNNYPIK